MAQDTQRLVSLDSSVLIEHFRKSKKENSFFYKLSQSDIQGFIVSVIVNFEIFKGATNEQISYWNNLFEDFIVVPYTVNVNKDGLKIYKQLKRIRKSIEIPDLIIAATALHHQYSLATLNEKHFDNIEGLNLITPSSFQP